MKLIFLFLVTAMSYCAGYSQSNALFVKQLFIEKTDTLPYRILLPDNYDPENKYPLIIFLHGSGERGNDNEKQLTHGAELFLRDSIRKKIYCYCSFSPMQREQLLEHCKYCK